MSKKTMVFGIFAFLLLMGASCVTLEVKEKEDLTTPDKQKEVQEQVVEKKDITEKVIVDTKVIKEEKEGTETGKSAPPADSQVCGGTINGEIVGWGCKDSQWCGLEKDVCLDVPYCKVDTDCDSGKECWEGYCKPVEAGEVQEKVAGPKDTSFPPGYTTECSDGTDDWRCHELHQCCDGSGCCEPTPKLISKTSVNCTKGTDEWICNSDQACGKEYNQCYKICASGASTWTCWEAHSCGTKAGYCVSPKTDKPVDSDYKQICELGESTWTCEVADTCGSEVGGCVGY